MNYNRYNGKKHFYIGGSMVKDTRRVHRMRIGIMRLGVMLIVLVCLILWNDTGV